MTWNPDCKGPCDCPGTERAESAIPYMMEDTPEEFQRVRSLPWPASQQVQQAVSATPEQHAALAKSIQDLAAKADSTNDPILGDEIRALTPMGARSPSGMFVQDESWDFTKALEGAWAWGYAAAQRDALDRPYSDRPEAATWQPTPNPYTAGVDARG